MNFPKGNQYAALSVEEVFESQRRRVKGKLAYCSQHYRDRIGRLGIGADTVEVRGTSGGGPSLQAVDEQVSAYRLYGGS